jgi:hypothetical protein
MLRGLLTSEQGRDRSRSAHSIGAADLIEIMSGVAASQQGDWALLPCWAHRVTASRIGMGPQLQLKGRQKLRRKNPGVASKPRPWPSTVASYSRRPPS